MSKLRSKFSNISVILITLNVFFLSIALMGAFKGEGKEIAKALMSTLYHNPVLGLMLGVFATAVMQSSSSTTSIVVSFLATGMFGDNISHALYAAIPIIMGANIGTSITNAIVSMGHIGDIEQFKRAFGAATVHDIFNVLTVIILFPIQVYTNFLGKLSLSFAELFEKVGGLHFASPIKLLIKPQQKFIVNLLETHPFVTKLIIFFIFSYVLAMILKYFLKNIVNGKSNTLLTLLLASYISLFALGVNMYADVIFKTNLVLVILALFMLFGSLAIFVSVVRNAITGKVELLFNNYIFKNATRAFAVGIVLTVLVQSSSVTTSIVVPLAGVGILNTVQIFPYTLGANIGTTITALLAALSLGNVASLAAAFAHLLFNIIGTLMFLPFAFMRQIPIYLSQKFANSATYSRVIPIIIVAFIYIIVPLLGILLTKN